MSNLAPGQVYAMQRRELLDLARSLTADQAATVVALSPAWTVKDVVAHVCGINADVLAGNVTGVGTESWTAAQVDGRAGHSIGEVCDEWESMAGEVDALGAAQPALATRATGDLVSHYHDVLTALGRTGQRDSAPVRLALERYGSAFVERAGEAGLPIIRVQVDGPPPGDDLDTGEQGWPWPEGEPAIVLSGTAFELLRAFSGRRSLSQIRAMDWSGDPDAYLNMVAPYELPVRDVAE